MGNQDLTARYKVALEEISAGFDTQGQGIKHYEGYDVNDLRSIANNALKEQFAENGSGLTAPGAAFEGGYFVDKITVNGERFALIVAPKSEGEKMDLEYKKTKRDIADDTDTEDDGFHNSCLINDVNHPAAQFCRTLRIAGHDDWYLPSRDELMIIWMALGPNRKKTPDAFKADAPEAFETTWYWSSTEHASYSGFAWFVGFYGGYQFYNLKHYGFGVRAVRRLKL
jgi:hypothetical protein